MTVTEPTIRKKICYPFVGDSVGGSQISATLLIQEMKSRGFDTHVILHQEGPFADYLRARDIPYRLLTLDRFVGVRAGFLRTAADLAGSATRLFRFIREESIDIVHGNDTRINLTWVAATRAAGAKYVWHQRTILTPQRTTRALVRVANQTICVSEFVRKQSSLRQSTVIHNPFRLPEDNRPSTRELLLEQIQGRSTAKIVGFIGRLVPWKNPERLVELLPAVRESTGMDVRACFFGVGAQQLTQHLRDMALMRGVQDEVHFLGFRDPIEPFIQACDVLLAPSTGEPFGRALVEAALNETPVVASDSGGHPEIITDGITGFLVDVDDLDRMTDRVVSLLSDEALRRRITDAARADAKQRFSVEAHADAITLIYETLAGLSAT